MSEEILKALTQLFAIISTQDEGLTSVERDFVIKFLNQELEKRSVEEYIQLYDQLIQDEEDRIAKRKAKAAKKRAAKGESAETDKALTDAVSVRNSVRTLSLCRKINKTLDQKQKTIVMVKLLELVSSDKSFTPQRMDIIHTVADVFNIPSAEYKLLERFIIETHSSKIDNEDILIFDDEMPPEGSKIKFIDSGLLDGEIIFIRLKSVALYFTKYTGKDTIYLNGQPVAANTIHLFSPGSIFKTPKGAPLYYSDLVNKYNSDEINGNISFIVENLEYKFPNGGIGLRDINFGENSGQLIGIMGASGAGKTTLLNVLAGLETPSGGEVRINGYNIHKEKDKIEGVIGYIAQDDLLIEELTVFQNLFYNAKLCFKDMSEEELTNKVTEVLESLGLDRIAHLVVGNVLNKKISGGQRKRLNIALELIREPAVMFVDEPTSGLSSRDSENVIDLLKELSLKGKLIFVVIHQPSSDIYKMFDKMWLLDTGGYPVFYGNPIEAITHFKSAAGQVDSDQGQCNTCGNVNPEQLFNIIEAQVVDEYGEFTNKRKATPEDWYRVYTETFEKPDVEEVHVDPPKTLRIPSKLKQTAIFTVRDFLSKFSNKQYLLINLLEAPFLALLLSWIIYYIKDGDTEYLFRHNENVPAYILIAILVALFMGMTVSAEEIIKDRKIKKRESFLNLSRSSYLFSKLIILFGFSAVQTATFVLIGNTILEIPDLSFAYWLVLFTVSCHANMIGLNISSAFNSAITVYILIPILLIPQMILSGLIFDFSKLNNTISQHGKTPLIADVMTSRWAYEALSVEQYKNNRYEKPFFDIDMKLSQSNYKSAYWEPKMEEILYDVQLNSKNTNDSTAKILKSDILTLTNEINSDLFFTTHSDKKELALDYLSDGKVSSNEGNKLRKIFYESSIFYNDILIKAEEERDTKIYKMKKELGDKFDLSKSKNLYYNNQLETFVKNKNVLNRTVVDHNRIIQLIDPIFFIKENTSGPLDYRTHLFAPEKKVFGTYIDTFTFNVLMIWLMSLILYFTLYFELLKKLIEGVEVLFSRIMSKEA
ncbi:ATP-binding cassette domain-containing protein [Flammeovirga kamogawensis]|uniref:ATP-binding cassette domain-containing protein n=1 Tax=Flammeovirga kamogawensis TaxID=373891 RepID=A0ABX8GV27_9BACT|nr:ATP-binding cassette domain-containing protein [Flammeovirga kamogawensis]MBB6461648.1 ABC-type multidrug transport system ATPase subunit [Flammeovirga kamogawensis]QWG07426.1 ATP-binding cassette domain-containing protein [Flammeovirga kamogawensis]TRX69237.1 ATP-binding cassette domain-containing protein [Flammeovirga kamogawensis]